jgi:hypothetical protein
MRPAQRSLKAISAKKLSPRRLTDHTSYGVFTNSMGPALLVISEGSDPAQKLLRKPAGMNEFTNGRTRDQMEEAFKSGVQVRRFCYDLYRSKAQYLLQRWYGKRGDAEKFAEQEADALEGEDGDAMYAVIGQQIALTERRNFLSITDFSWERLSRGFIAVIRNANQVEFRKRELNIFLYLCCVNQQLDTAAELLEGFQAESWDGQFWGNQVTLDQVREFVKKAQSQK